MTAAGAPELDALMITIVVDNATDTLSSVTPGVPQLPEMAYLLGGPSTGRHDGHDCVVTLDRLCVACHGFSALAEARLGDRTATVLFDVGPYLAGVTVEDRIEPTVRDLAELVDPNIVAPGHCTGWRAATALATAFGPNSYAPSVVGTRYLLTVAAS